MVVCISSVVSFTWSTHQQFNMHSILDLSFSIFKVQKSACVQSQGNKCYASSHFTSSQVHKFQSSADGLAWDWVNKKLYWTDAANKAIEVIDPHTFYRKLLISTGNTSIPRAIIVDPQNK